MSLLQTSIQKPVSVMVGVIVVCLFGMLALLRLPVQLTPDVDRPILTVNTRWEGASPAEVEQEIVNEQEDQLKRVQGLRKMTSTASEGSASIELEFQVGVDTTRALLEVTDKLRQVREYPENVDEPTVSSGETEGANAIAWFMLRVQEGSPYKDEDLPTLFTFMDEKVKPQLERAEGVSSVGVVGGIEQEVQVSVDPLRLAARDLTMLDVRSAIQRRNVDISAGDIEQGKSSILVRTVGKFQSLADIEDLVLARRDGKNVRLRDVGRAELGYKEADLVVRSIGEAAIAINAQRESGSNIIEVMAALKQAIEDVNRDVLGPKGLYLAQVYDQTQYIYSAIDLVLQNLWVGGAMAVAVLLLFLRDGRSTLVIGLAIPISVIGSFLALTLMGRNLNVVSLAGLAFAVGMVVDNSIVVLENIFRHRSEGATRAAAALRGAQEVWGAVLASTLTTLAVFLPVLFVEEEAGQLFRDIAIAISASVALSLVVSVLFIPMAAARVMATPKPSKPGPLRRAGAAFVDGVTALVGWLNAGVLRRLATVGGLTGAAVLGAWLLMPPMAYLPDGNQNLIIGFVIPPPGYNSAELLAIAHTVEEELEPYWEADPDRPLPKELAYPDWYDGDKPIPALENFFFVARGQSVFMGGRSASETNIAPMKRLYEHAGAQIPGVMMFSSQRSLFERGLQSGNAIDLEVSGYNLDSLNATALRLLGRIAGAIGPARPTPSNFHLGGPEIRLRPIEDRAAELGLSARDVGFIVQCMVDGAFVGDYRHQGVTLDIKLMPEQRVDRDAASLARAPLFTPAGRRVPLSEVAVLEETMGPNQIRHTEERRSVLLSITPPAGMELARAMDLLQEQIVTPMRADGSIPPDVSVRFSGTADKLISTRRALQWNFLLALVLTYLLLAALFESFLYPLVILFSVPLAAVGGILALRIVHEVNGQQMDVLTMLGFVILIGTVVNNAILIVHQALNRIREHGDDPADAIRESVRTRIRPIFMSTGTSVLGMMPLVLFPGAGSELYRGLGSVVVGGLIASTLFTLLVVPTLLSLVFALSRRVTGLRVVRKVA